MDDGARGATMQDRHPSLVNADDLEFSCPFPGTRFSAESVRLADAAGGVALGASLYRFGPGAIDFPHHWHSANEEAMFVISGSGTLRLGSDQFPIRARDWVSLPVGPEHVHQLIGGDEGLEVLVMSTRVTPDVIRYPDSAKIAVNMGPFEGGRFIAHDANLDGGYLDGELGDESE